MLLLIVSPSFRRYFRPKRQTEGVPIEPMVDIALYWCCSILGGLFAAVGAMALFAATEIPVAIAMIVASAPLFWVAWRAWWKLNH
jgi:hypothetical protein